MQMLEKEYSQNNTGKCTVTVGSETYTIDFTSMTQINNATQTQRHVKREEQVELQKTGETDLKVMENLVLLQSIFGEMMGEDILLEILQNHPLKDDMDALVNQMMAPDFRCLFGINPELIFCVSVR